MENLRSSQSKSPDPTSAVPRRRLLFDTPRRPLLPSSSSRTVYSDRFIPSRTGSNFDLFNLPSSAAAAAGGGEDASRNAYTTLLRDVLFGRDNEVTSPFATTSKNIFRYKSKTPRNSLFPAEDDLSCVRPTYSKAPQKIRQTPMKVLDAPDLQDNFYVNLVDWSSNNVVAAGLGSSVHLLNDCNKKVTKLCDMGVNDSVSSVCWAKHGNHLAVGTYQGEVQIWDASRCQRIRTMMGHHRQVGALSWSSSVLSSGGRDIKILHRDIHAPEHFVSELIGHTSEVCGMKWSHDDFEFASGGNDNRLLVWNQHSTRPVLMYNAHKSAVKAIAWSPHRHGLLASGGGIADRSIRFWNTTTGSPLNCMDTESQVCNLAWSENVNELVSTHGYSKNQIIVWKYPTMSKLATLTGHTFRVLYLAISPDGQTILTGAGDETLRFWNVFPPSKSQKTNSTTGSNFGASSLGRTYIR